MLWLRSRVGRKHLTRPMLTTHNHFTSLGLRCAVGCLVVALSAGFACAFETIHCRLADGFDHAVGKPDSKGYHKARGFWPNGHLGEDWNGNTGGDTDLGDPIYTIGNGVVVLSEDVKMGWGNCIIIRHAYRDTTGKIEMVDSLYGHLLQRLVKVGQCVERGELIGKMGSNNGMYPAHLHLEVRKNLAIGMNRTKFARDYSNYYSPTAFIEAHRRLPADFKKYDIPINTFAAHGQDLNPEQQRLAGNQSPTSASRPNSGLPTLPALSGGGAKNTGHGISIPITSGGTSASRGGGSPSKTGDSGNNQTPKTGSVPAATEEAKGDFWTRMKSKLNNGQAVDPQGAGP